MVPKTIQNAIDWLTKLPGIGPRHASRLVFHMLAMPEKEIHGLADAIRKLTEKIESCPVCFSSFEIQSPGQKTCTYCADTKRSKTLICVVAKETDRDQIEKTGAFKGVYHVVGENADTLDAAVPPSIARLLERVAYIKKQLPPAKQGEMEVILATDATTEGEALAAYLENKIRPLGVRAAQLGRGLASGLELEYADQHTLAAALKNRT